MDSNLDIRPLTQEEQLEYLISFLEAQIEQYKFDLLAAKEELLMLKTEQIKTK